MTGFVDDTSILLGDFDERQTPSQLLNQLRQEAELWDSLLHASGGKLEVAKCSFSYAIWLGDERGIPRLEQMEAPQVTIRAAATGHEETIRHIPPEGAHKTLGVMLLASRNTTAKFARLKTLVAKHAATLWGSGFSQYQADTYARRIAGPSIGYGLACSTFPKKALDKLQKPLIAAHLNSTRFPLSFPRAVAHAPRGMLGLGIPPLHVTQGGSSAIKLLRHIRHGTELGKQILIDIDWAQLEAGTSYGIFDTAQQNLPHLNLGWTTSVRDYMALCNMRMTIHALCLPRLRRGDDVVLMDEALRKLTPHCCRAVNRCRLFLQVETVAEICNLQGTRIMEWAWNCVHPIDHWERSTIRWPRQPRPNMIDIRIWRSFLSLAFCSNDRRLFHALGPWIAGSDNDRTARAGVSGNTLVIQTEGRQRLFTQVRPGCLTTGWHEVAGPIQQAWREPVQLRWLNEHKANTTSASTNLLALPIQELWEATILQSTTFLCPPVHPLDRITAVSDGGVKDGKGYFGFTI